MVSLKTMERIAVQSAKGIGDAAIPGFKTAAKIIGTGIGLGYATQFAGEGLRKATEKLTWGTVFYPGHVPDKLDEYTTTPPYDEYYTGSRMIVIQPQSQAQAPQEPTMEPQPLASLLPIAAIGIGLLLLFKWLK